MIILKVKVRSPGSATIINAISTGCGSAFGIQLYITVEAELTATSKINCKTDKNVDTSLMDKQNLIFPLHPASPVAVPHQML